MTTSTKVFLCFLMFAVISEKGGCLPNLSIFGESHALPGSDVEFTCFEPNPTRRAPNIIFTYQWFKDDIEMPDRKNQTLFIYNVSSGDEGEYSCRLVENGTRKASSDSGKHPFSLAVPPKVEIEEAKGKGLLKLAEGKDLSLTCHLVNAPYPPLTLNSYRWTFLPIDGRNLSGMCTDTDFTINRDWISGREVNLLSKSGQKTKSSLALRSVKTSQSGRYTCHASNYPSSSQKIPPGAAEIYVLVLSTYLDQPLRISPARPQTVVAGDNVTLTCQVDSVPTATLTWLYQGRILRKEESNEIIFSFTATGCEDSGEYQCRAHNGAVNETASNGTSILVECPPSPVGSGNSSQVTEVSGTELEDLTLSVNASGNPPPVYTWSGPALKSDHRSSSVTLHRLLPLDAGTYSVNVSNVHGSFLHTFHVIVHAEKHKVEVPVVDTDSNWWLWVIGAVVLVPVLVFFYIFGIRRHCSRGHRHDSSHNNDKHQHMELRVQDFHDGSGRRQGKEGADYVSGESMVHYWSIDSADLPWPPQPDPQQHSSSQDSQGLDYNVPLNPGGLPLPRPHVSRDEDPYPASDVTSTCDVITTSDTDSRDEVNEGILPGETSSMPLDSRPQHWEEDQFPEDSEAYCEWSVVSSSEARPLFWEEDDSIFYCEWSLVDSQEAGPLYREEDQFPEDSEAYCEWSVVSSPEAWPPFGEEDDSIFYCEWNLVGPQEAGPLYREEDQLCEDSKAYSEWEEVSQHHNVRNIACQTSDLEYEHETPVYMDMSEGKKI